MDKDRQRSGSFGSGATLDLDKWVKRGGDAFRRGGGVARSPERGRVEEVKDKRKVVDTSFDDGDGDGKKKKGRGKDIGMGAEILERLDEIKASFMEQFSRIREELMVTIDDLRQEMRTEMTMIKKEREEATKKMEGMMVEQERRWRGEVERMEKEVNVMKSKVQDMEDKEELKERQARRANVVISGPDLSKDIALKSMNIDGVKKFLEEKLGLDIGVEEVWRVGKEESTKLVTRLAGWDDKMKVVKNKRKLGRECKIFIDDDYTKKERSIQAFIRDEMWRRRRENIKAYMGYKKLIVGDDVYLWNEGQGKLVKKTKVWGRGWAREKGNWGRDGW